MPALLTLSRLAALAATAALAVACRGTGPPAPLAEPAGAPGRDARLAAALRGLAARTGGEVGLHARHVESGWQTGLAEDRPFFMASVTKLPVAVRVLRQVERGRLRLADPVVLTVRSPGHSPLFDAHPSGVRATVEELLRAAVTQSDNSASDALLRLGGGPDSVSAEMRALGLPGIRVDRPYTRLGPEVGPRAEPADPRDSATPAAVTALLAALHGGRVLDARGTELLLGWMAGGGNPDGRLVAGVPAGTRVAHKTGTWGAAAAPAAVNDVGLVTLPGGRGHLAVAVLVRNAAAPTPQVEAAVAALARALYEHWTSPAAAGAGPSPHPTPERQP